MNAASRFFFFVSKYVVIASLMFALSMPVVVLSQGETATTTTESILPVDSIAATTIVPTPITTDEFPPSLIEEETTTGKVFGESMLNQTEEMTEESIEEDEVDEEEDLEEPTQPIIEIYTPPKPTLSRREFKRRVIPDARAFHFCEAETFNIDVTGKSSAKARIALHRDRDAPYEIEIGGLPQGIDITFAKNGAYRHAQRADDRTLDLAVTNQSGSQKGNFSVPIIYTQKGSKDSSVVCQINIINL